MGYPEELELRVLIDPQFRRNTALGRKIAASAEYKLWRKEEEARFCVLCFKELNRTI